MIASVVSTYCWPSGPSISATSSISPSAPGAASGAKKRAMRSNSPRRGAVATVIFPRTLGPERPREPVEHAVDEPWLLAGEESMRDVEIFADGNADRHFRPRQQFVSTRTQDRAQDDLEPLQRPIRRERRGDLAIELLAPRRSAFDQLREQALVGGAEILALALMAKAMAKKFHHHVGR